MVRYYCPKCWCDFAEDVRRCPECGQDIQAFLRERDYVERLIAALNHPEPETPIRAAWILGRIGGERAVEPLISLVTKTKDDYIARTAVEALARIGTPEAMAFLRTLAAHPAQMVRQAAAKGLAVSDRPAAAEEEGNGRGCGR